MNKNTENSYWVNKSDWVNESKWVNESYWVNWSDWVNKPDWVNESYWVNLSDWVNLSYWVINSYWVDREIFCADKKRTFNIFWIEVEEIRFNKVFSEINNLNNWWFPKFNNAFDLLDEHWEWSKVPVLDIKSKLGNWEEPYEAWKDMPQETIDYIKSLPEFNPDIFKRVTWIDIEEKTEEMTMEEVCKALWKNIKIKK